MSGSSTLYTSQPITAHFDSASFMLGGGVAIFHLATGRVVLCSYESKGRKVYFLPKGRRDAGEESGVGAEREGYEEVCPDGTLSPCFSPTTPNQGVNNQVACRP